MYDTVNASNPFHHLIFSRKLTIIAYIHNSHQFKLDKWTDQGPTIAAAFGSESYQDIYELHLIVAEMIGKSPGGAGLAELGHSRDAGEDSSGYFSGAQSVGSNPTFARRAPGQSGKYTYT